jgi:hypothetical protein
MRWLSEIRNQLTLLVEDNDVATSQVNGVCSRQTRHWEQKLESSQHIAQHLREANQCQLTATANDNHSRSHYCVCVLYASIWGGYKDDTADSHAEYKRKREMES